MRPEVATRAAECLHELTIYFKQIGIGSPVKIDSQFDEFNLDYDIHYGARRSDFLMSRRAWRLSLRRSKPCRS